ncbi:MAG TPA: acetylxylan esterase [Caulifigura sp.]|jgi:cephalosporin-C deacetylase-like acetyl esterase|nr:acetylxylan esterase [Caulifigura sp.]
MNLPRLSLPLPAIVLSTLLLLTPTVARAAYSVDVRLDRLDGYYKVGQDAVCTITLLRDGQPAVGEKLRCTIKRERELLRQDEFVCNGQPWRITAAMDRPGWLFFAFEIIGPDGKPLAGKGVYKHSRKPTIVGEIGALYDADQIKALDSCPADFDAYWASCRSRLDQVPLDPKLTEVAVPAAQRGKVRCYSIEVQCLSRNPVTGYLALPVDAKPGSLLAHVSYQSRVWQDASKRRAIEMASKGVLALDVTWHGRPTGGTEEDYLKRREAEFPEEGRAGDTDRDTWLGHDMYLRVLRALDFIKSRPEWNHKDLIVSGGSLGGIQTITAAALDRDVTVAVVSVPSGCEYNGYKQGRDAAGLYRGKQGIARIEADPRRTLTLAYHDAVNMAPRITCDIYVCTGFADESCTPSSVFAFYNALPATTRKFMTTNPTTGHYGSTKNTAGDQRLAEMFRTVTVD